jgi:aminopeptidase N
VGAAAAARAQDASLGYGMRKESLDALAGTARTAEGRAVLREYLAGTRKFDGAPVKQPTRWGIVQRLLSLGEPDAPALLAAEVRRDSTPEAGRRAFVAGAAAPAAAVKAEYFRRYLDDPALNEEWVTASLGAFNDARADAAHAALPAPVAGAAGVDPRQPAHLLPAELDQRLRARPALRGGAGRGGPPPGREPVAPPDIRRKVLQARDELERTVARRVAGEGAVGEGVHLHNGLRHRVSGPAVGVRAMELRSTEDTHRPIDSRPTRRGAGPGAPGRNLAHRITATPHAGG